MELVTPIYVMSKEKTLVKQLIFLPRSQISTGSDENFTKDSQMNPPTLFLSFAKIQN